jgi:hypothetical protein
MKYKYCHLNRKHTTVCHKLCKKTEAVNTTIFILKTNNVFIINIAMNVGPCHHGMARPQAADGGMASYMEGSCE